MNAEIEILKEQGLQKLADRMLAKRKRDMNRLLDTTHRLQLVGEFDGIEFINDAKSQDLESTAFSLDSISKPVFWIVEAGPYQRNFANLDLDTLNELESVIVVGQNRAQTVEELFQLVDVVVEANTIQEAVDLSKELAFKGSCVLYSPAIPNNNTYGDFESRGDAFIQSLH
ncbi:MAG: hypothetical protein AAF487_01340 [Bacteroidota bacterium]